MNALKNALTVIKQVPLKEANRVGTIRYQGGKLKDYTLMVKKTTDQATEPVFKTVEEWKNGIEGLCETHQIYSTPFINRDTLKFMDKFVIKIGERDTMTIIKNYFEETVKIIKTKKDIWGETIRKEVSEFKPAFDLENIKPSRAHVEELQRDALNYSRRYVTEFRNKKPFNAYCDKGRIFKTSDELIENDLYSLIDSENIVGKSRKMFSEEIKDNITNYFYKDGNRLV